MFADHQRKLGFALEDGGWNVGKDHGIAVANHRVGRLLERVNRGRPIPCAILHIVHSHADDVGGLGQWRAQPDLVQGLTLAAVHRLLQCGAVLREILDDLADQVLG